MKNGMMCMLSSKQKFEGKFAGEKFAGTGGVNARGAGRLGDGRLGTGGIGRIDGIGRTGRINALDDMNKLLPEIITNPLTGSISRRGRPKKALTQEKLDKVLRLYFVERMSMREIADVLEMPHMSVYRMLSDPNVELLL